MQAPGKQASQPFADRLTNKLVPLTAVGDPASQGLRMSIFIQV